jgi:prepilin-type N-terminal cleavage/methylation domain-containing protein
VTRFNERLIFLRVAWNMRQSVRNLGFTLIELSVVLVIIGLVVGSIFVGRELIRAAELHRIISQQEGFKTAVNTFKLKYNYIPGDIPPSATGRLGFFTFDGPFAAAAGGIGYGDGNGLVEGNLCSREQMAFWRHLSDAQLIGGTYGSIGAATLNTNTGTVTAQVSDFSLAVPSLANRSASWMVRTATLHNNYNYLANTYGTLRILELGPNICSLQTDKDLTGHEAFIVDTKLDDGLPNTGRVQAASHVSCITGGDVARPATDIYDVSALGCSILVAF